MALQVGFRLGHYDVTALIGEGGMGQVYQATDTKLNRQVALKILPEAFAGDPDRLARFEREAKVLASLNHPNIAAIHGLEDSEGTKALVLELVEGPTLADRIAQGPIPVDEALPIAKQIAEALEAAHEAGVIHRDLKPANIKVRDDGTVKVLDFGLAKALDTVPEGDPNQSPTLTAAATQMGVIMGTAAYMSPEQARGRPVDRRTDVWAFGAVLYEMLTGARPFAGDDLSETLAHVIDREPDWAALPASVPPVLASFLRRCLQKDPRERMRDIGDVRLAMDVAVETSDNGRPAAPDVPELRAWQRPTALAVGGVLLLMIGAVAGWEAWGVMRPGVGPANVARFSIQPPDTVPMSISTYLRDLAISPGGRSVVFGSPRAESSQLHLRAIDRMSPTPISGGVGHGPFFSPEGQWVGYYDRGSTILEKVSILGGPPVRLTESPRIIRGTTWGTDDRIIFGTLRGGLLRVSGGGGGGEPEVLTTYDPDQGDHTWPSIIPGHDALLFVMSRGFMLDTGQIAVLDLTTGGITDLGLAGVSPRYVSTGHLVYAAVNGSIRAVPFDAASLTVTGNPVPLVEDVMVKNSGAANFDVSENGSLVYVSAEAGAGSGRWTLVWVDRQGQEEPFLEEPADYWFPRLSPDGRRLAVTIADTASSSWNIWVVEIERRTRTPFTFEGDNHWPLWTPDGQYITFGSSRLTGRRDALWRGMNLYWKRADRSGEAEPLFASEAGQIPTSWSPNGQVLAFHATNPTSAQDIWLVPREGEAAPFLVGPFNERGAVFSPDGGWVAYVSDESGRTEVYVRPYPGPGSPTQFSTDGGREPMWSPGGGELLYRIGDAMMAVAIETEPTLQLGATQQLFEGRYLGDPDRANYDVASNGERFLMVKEPTPQIIFVENWFEELKRLVPTN